MRQGLSRLALALVLFAFCLPLFFGLGAADLANDEAIYSFAVESILRTGDWLSPRSSPNLHIVFLEKPPLKFWIVAAPIRLGILPFDEFGLRFWDALFGAIAFVYVFLLGRRLAGPVCGVTAVMVLFAHDPLVFDHGLRSNNMDAALLLAYCAGVYHFLRWAGAAGRGARLRHAAVVGAAFYLGFMTKFVAALFLPLVLGASAFAAAAPRRRLLADVRPWIAIAGAVVLLAAPWFVYEYVRHGRVLLEIMFGEHVYTRFTSFADPAHLKPWHFYVSTVWQELAASGSGWWTAWGVAILLVDVVRRRAPYEGRLVLVWLALPVALISLGSSKLYHYFYPYLPPIALAAGYGVAWLLRALRRLADALIPGRPTAPALTPAVRMLGLAIVAISLVVAILTAVDGAVRLGWGDQPLFRNTSVERPLVVAALAIGLVGGVRSGLAAVAVIVIWLVLPTPLAGYISNLEQLRSGAHPLRSLSECIRSVHAARQAAGHETPGTYAPVSEDAYLHPYFYYLRGSGWHARAIDPAVMHEALLVPGRERPVVVDRRRFAEYLARAGGDAAAVARVELETVVVLLPGSYAPCQPPARVHPARRGR